MAKALLGKKVDDEILVKLPKGEKLTNLKQMTEQEIGMQTTVLIGNSQTFVKHGVMIMPRGYGDKYAIQPVANREQ